MTTTIRTIHVAPGSELDRLLAELAGDAAVLERDGVRYHLNRADGAPAVDVWADYDPDNADAAFVASAGTLAGVDIDQLLCDLAAQRAEDTSRGPR
jgi:hypothetical protein